MALTVDEIRPGVVAVLDTSTLLRDRRLTRRGDDMFRSGPFVCIAVEAGRTIWLKITTKPGQHHQRFAIEPQWRHNGSALWRKGEQYLGDMRDQYVGRDVVFIDAAVHEPPFPFGRPYIDAAGVAAIFAEMDRWERLTAYRNRNTVVSRDVPAL